MSQNARILIIDDDPLFRSLLVTLLRKGNLVSVASHGQEGYQKAVAHPPDIVILDIQMPGWGGLRTLNEFRNHPMLKNVKAMVLTSDASRETVISAIQAGANDYVIKTGFSKEDFLAKVNHLIALATSLGTGSVYGSATSRSATTPKQPVYQKSFKSRAGDSAPDQSVARRQPANAVAAVAANTVAAKPGMAMVNAASNNSANTAASNKPPENTAAEKTIHPTSHLSLDEDFDMMDDWELGEVFGSDQPANNSQPASGSSDTVSETSVSEQQSISAAVPVDSIDSIDSDFSDTDEGEQPVEDLSTAVETHRAMSATPEAMLQSVIDDWE